MITIRSAKDRGAANFGWLHSRHSFSFGRYYDPKHMGWSVLRVINDDWVAPGAGFEPHSHKDMEIISLVMKGTLEHKDSMGTKQILPPDEFQLMSAGSGIIHSEYNASQIKELKFLQIWIKPNVLGGEPGYQQRAFGQRPGVTPIITPDGEGNTLQIRQNARLSQVILLSGQHEMLSVRAGRKMYLHVITGHGQVDNSDIFSGDGVAIEDQSEVRIENIGDQAFRALFFDLP